MEMDLQMPRNYVEVTEEEMMYVVGGTSIGSMIAVGFDRADGKNDGYLFA